MLAATFAAGLAVGGFAAGLGRGAAPRSAAPGGDRARPEPDPPAGRRAEPIREVGWVDLVDGSAGRGARPAGPDPLGAGPGRRWLSERPPSVPEYVRAQWERQGYQVEERRRLVSVELEDGRRVSIPVDEVELEYVGQKPL